MARGGYFAGGDYVPYQPGNLTKSTSTSAREFTRQKTVKCPKCTRVVPKRDKCIFCNTKF